jgi:hypothetical protein
VSLFMVAFLLPDIRNTHFPRRLAGITITNRDL